MRYRAAITGIKPRQKTDLKKSAKQCDNPSLGRSEFQMLVALSSQPNSGYSYTAKGLLKTAMQFHGFRTDQRRWIVETYRKELGSKS